jgi:hypothetical protein
MRKILVQGHENRTKWWETKDQTAKEALDEALGPIVRAAERGLLEIPAGRGDQVRFVRVVLNSTGAGFDAVKFRTPATGEMFSPRLEIVVPGNDYTRNLRSWDLVGVDGAAPVVNDFSRRDSFDLPGAGFPEENYCVTSHFSGALRSVLEYIVWIDLKNDQATSVYVKVALTPAGEPTSQRTAGLTRARGTYQTTLKSLNRRYDLEVKRLRQAYVAELDKAEKAADQEKDRGEADRIVAEAEELVRREQEGPGRRGFRIISARFGIDDRWADVTDELRPLIRGNALRFGLGTDVKLKNDPAFGVWKRLRGHPRTTSNVRCDLA